MNAIQSSTDYANLAKVITHQYHAAIDAIYLHRDNIGYVYFLKSNSKKYVLKLYRWFDSDNALRSINIIQFLKNNDYPVVSIVPTACGEMYMTVMTPQGESVAILFDYIEGTEPNFETELTNIGRQVGWLHRIMKDYPGPFIRRGKDFYIDRYISIFHEKKYALSRIADLVTYGSELWSKMERLPGGFCHGDLHSGNMLQTEANKYVLFDFDIASHTYPMIDAATLSDGTNFNNFHEGSYDRTMRMFERFYQGYSKESELSGAEIAAIVDFIAIRHYEIIATIIQCQGLEDVSCAFLDEQYEWLMNWKNLCDRKAARFA